MDLAEIEENEFNLNIPRYVDTFEPEEEIEVATAVKDLEIARAKEVEVEMRLDALLGKVSAK